MAAQEEQRLLDRETGYKPPIPSHPAAATRLDEIRGLLNSLGIVGPNIIHAEQGMWPDGKHSYEDTWDGPGWCVCSRIWPCEALRLGEVTEGALAEIERLRGALEEIANPEFVDAPGGFYCPWCGTNVNIHGTHCPVYAARSALGAPETREGEAG